MVIKVMELVETKWTKHSFFSRILVDENYINELVFYSTEKF